MAPSGGGGHSHTGMWRSYPQGSLMHEGFRLPRQICPAHRPASGVHGGPRRRRRGRSRDGRARGGCAADVRLRRQGAPSLVDAGRSGRLACVAWRLPRARALASPSVAPISGGTASPCWDPHPSGGGRLRGAGTASALGLALGFRARPGIADGFVSPAGSSPGLRARHGRVCAVEAALERLAVLRARAGLRGRCAGRDRRIACLVVAGAPASPGLGRWGACSGPCGASYFVRSPARCAGCRVAGSAHARGSTRAAGGVR